MKSRLVPAVAAVTLLCVTPASLAQSDEPGGGYLHGRPSGLYVGAAGMIVNPDSPVDLDDKSLTFSNAEVTYDTGYGARGTIGWSFENTPLSLEAEYAYRYTDVDRVTNGGVTVGSGGDQVTHAFMANAVLDFDTGFSNFGFYLGAGGGLALTESNIGGIGDDDDFSLAWQVFGGINYYINSQWMVYGGARWFDAGGPDYANYAVSNRSLNFELGFRFYF